MDKPITKEPAPVAKPAPKIFDVQIIITPAGWIGVPHLKPRND